jgi:hypothetical protein
LDVLLSPGANTEASFSANSREFEIELYASRVYKRVDTYEEDASFANSAVRTATWSMLSGLSLARISAISVIALPLSYTETRDLLLTSSRTPLARVDESPVTAGIPLALETAPVTLSDTQSPIVLWDSFSIRSPLQLRVTGRVNPQYRSGKMTLYKLVILGDGGVGKTELANQVSVLL